MAIINGKAIEVFLTKVRDDGAFGRKIFEAIDPAQVQSIAGDAGIKLTMDDIMASKELLMEALDTVKQKELTNRELENNAGGFAAPSSPNLDHPMTAPQNTFVSLAREGLNFVQQWKW